MVFRIYLAINMLIAACLPGARTRTTISGYVGERALRGSRIAAWLAVWLDRLHPWDPDHCRVTFEQEQQCREILYHDREHRQ